MSETSFKLGDQGEEIGDIQRKLACLGFDTGPQNRTFDDKLREAVTAFQAKYKLPKSGDCDPATWTRLDEVAGSLYSEILQYELDALRGTPPPAGVRPAAESKVIKRAHDLNLAGLAFSGGGIRSATFNLGILQALAENKLLRDFDYLSTVSGGGYIGGWFSKWLKERDGDIAKVEELLTPGSKTAPATEEPNQIKFLRQYSNYLTPKTGMFSADTWTVIATYIRNTTLNLCILIALLAAVLVLPRLLALLADDYRAHSGLFLSLGLAAFLWAVYFIALSISLNRFPASQRSILSQTQGSVIWLIVVPLMLAGFLCSIGLWEVREDVRLAWNRFVNDLHERAGMTALVYLWDERRTVFLFAILPGIVYFLVWLAGWGTAQYRNRPDPPQVNWKYRGKEGLGHLLYAILALGLGSLLVLLSLVWIGTWTAKSEVALHYSHLVSFGMPYLLCIFGITMLLLVGLIGRLYNDASREWWSRQGGWTIIFVLGWLGLFLVAFYAPALLFWINAKAPDWIGAVIASGWLGTTIGGVVAGRSSRTGTRDANPLLESMALIAPYIFTLGIVIAVATLVHILSVPGGADGMSLENNATPTQYLHRYLDDVEGSHPSRLLLVMAGFLIVGLLLAWRVDINKFSLYMMYRSRLVRAYLGASTKDRRPHPFTAFDAKDDPRLEDLFAPGAKRVQKPYHIINAALNLVKGKELAWQTRKASGFVFTPAFCGYELPDMPFSSGSQSARHAARGCFRPTALYGGDRKRTNDVDDGIKLGMAIAVSGAAVSPSMGYHSSPPLAFLMTIFNVRLGRWCPNTRSPTKWKHSGPRIGLRCLFAELFGLTDAEADFVYLSDGGHFENLGIYELVRRRCRLIVVVDAGADGKMNFEDLGNAIRKCYTDLRIEIDIDVGPIDRILRTDFSKAYCVTGRILYGKVDRGAPEGTLLYIKPSLTGKELADVLNYRKTDPEFPHQSTLDQWFDETQFESYRSLGYRIGTVALKDAAGKSEIEAPESPMRHDIAMLCDAICKDPNAPSPTLDSKATD